MLTIDRLPFVTASQTCYAISASGDLRGCCLQQEWSVDMAEQQARHTSSTDIDFRDVGTWIILVGLLAIGILGSLGGLAITRINQQAQTATGSQTVPASR
jgi:hypothetical protein